VLAVPAYVVLWTLLWVIASNTSRDGPSSTGVLESFRIVKIGVHSGIHFWLCVGVFAALLHVDAANLSVQTCDCEPAHVAAAWLYLLLSEMFMHGFCWHWYLGYFLSVHHSERPEPDDSAGTVRLQEQCQPTGSSYGLVTSILSGNLNFHVEHHDFPTAPWTNLPLIRQHAPEFYAALVSSDYLSAACSYFGKGRNTGYACT